jgi:capsular polysaccharide export protein
VVTIQLGIEGWMADKRSTLFRQAVYAGWGLTGDRLVCPRRTRELSLNERVAATLILYPVYTDSASRDHNNIETVIALLARQRGAGWRLGPKMRLYRLFRNLLLKR